MTLHRYPTSVPEALVDAYRRAKRRTSEIAAGAGTSPAERHAGMRRARHRRHLQAREKSFRIDTVGKAGRAVIRQLIRVISYADLAGLKASARMLDKSDALAERARACLEDNRPAEALAAARAARDLSPQDPRFHLAEAVALTLQEPRAPAADVIAAFRRAAGLQPKGKEPYDRLYAYLLEHHPADALRVAEEEFDRAPLEPAHALTAARAARMLGRLDLAEVYAGLAVFAAPWSPDCQALLDADQEPEAEPLRTMSRTA